MAVITLVSGEPTRGSKSRSLNPLQAVSDAIPPRMCRDNECSARLRREHTPAYQKSPVNTTVMRDYVEKFSRAASSLAGADGSSLRRAASAMICVSIGTSSAMVGFVMRDRAGR